MRYYFAWVDATETAFLPEHKRFDEEVFSFNLSQVEGDFAQLDITIVNPRVGLLAPGRKVWAWFAEEHPTGGTIPQFFGRLVGIPEDLQGEVVTLSFIARPEDFAVQKLALAETLKVAPFWDPIWFDPNKPDPDNVLEGRSALWHIDRITGEVTISDIINGEDGNIVLGEADVFYDSVHIRYGSSPVRNINVTASVSWEQIAKGKVDLSGRIRQAFFIHGSGSGFLIDSFTGEGLCGSWPKAGSSLGGGWNVNAAFARPIGYENRFTNFGPGLFLLQQDRPDGLPFEFFRDSSLFYDGVHGGLVFPVWHIDCQLVAGYDVTRQKSETLTFALSADVQALVTEPGDEEVLELSLSSSELTQALDPSGLIPIRDQRAASYFSTTRGAQSLEYVLMVARARLLARARCVNVEIEIPYDDAVLLGLSCRKNVIFSDVRLPGGVASGKIIDYSLALDGDSGKATAHITFACTIGNGATVSAVAGEPEYAEDLYVDEDYQRHTGQLVMPVAGEITYESIEGDPPNDDGINFFKLTPDRVIKGLVIENGANAQEANFPFHGPISQDAPHGDFNQYYYLDTQGLIVRDVPTYDPQKAIAALNDIPTKVTLTLRPLTGGPFQTNYALNVSDLMIPKLIDLEAST